MTLCGVDTVPLRLFSIGNSSFVPLRLVYSNVPTETHYIIMITYGLKYTLWADLLLQFHTFVIR